jgi:hypothetical protein
MINVLDQKIRAEIKEQRQSFGEAGSAVLAVLDMHPPKQMQIDWNNGTRSLVWICDSCRDSEGEQFTFPCPTVEAIQGAMGVQL